MERWFNVTIETEGPTPSVDGLEVLSETLEDLGAHGPAVGTATSTRGTAVVFSVDHPDQGLEAFADVSRWSLETFTAAAEKAGVAWDRLAALEVLTDAESERRLNQEPERFAGVTEVARMLGVSKQRIRELRQLQGFPAPVEELAAGPVWTVSSLRRFVREWPRRPGRPRRLWSDLERLVVDEAARGALPLEELTERERALLGMVQAGTTTSDVAERMALSEEAARSALRRLLEKLEGDMEPVGEGR